MIKVVLIGAGNLAMNFQKIFDVSSGVDLIQWYSRKLNKIRSFKNKISITDKISDLIPADIYLIAISDDAIAKMSSKIKTSALVVHCSGSIAIDELLCDAKKVSFTLFKPFQISPLQLLINFPFLLKLRIKMISDYFKIWFSKLGESPLK
jgi:predicted dinucleotide-utilizing enzyme